MTPYVAEWDGQHLWVEYEIGENGLQQHLGALCRVDGSDVPPWSVTRPGVIKVRMSDFEYFERTYLSLLPTRTLLTRWCDDTCLHCLSTEWCKHVAYPMLVQRSYETVDAILEKIDHEDLEWHWLQLLCDIVGVDPVQTKHRGIIAKATSDWRDWFKRDAGRVWRAQVVVNNVDISATARRVASAALEAGFELNLIPKSTSLSADGDIYFLYGDAVLEFFDDGGVVLMRHDKTTAEFEDHIAAINAVADDIYEQETGS